MLNEKYDTTFLGEAKYFLGIEIKRTEDGSYQLSQRNKIENLVKEHKLEDSKPTNTPLEANYWSLQDNQELLSTNEQYRSAIGSLLYISSSTRPDITAATHMLSRRNNNPRQKDWNCVKRIIRYLKTTINMSLLILSNTSTQLSLFSDSDFAQDLEDRKSTSGHVIFIGQSCISWHSRKQPTVALSSAEAEYISLSQAAQELKWMIKLCEDLKLKQSYPIKVFEDNQSAIKLAGNEKYSARTKHIDTKHHFIKDLCAKNIIQLQYVPTQEMTADIFTKPLPKPQFNFCRDNLNLV